MALLIVLTLFMVQTNAEKRLLLNDPDVILSQLHALERKMEEKYTDLSVKYNALLAQTNDMHAKMTQIPTQSSKSLPIKRIIKTRKTFTLKRSRCNSENTQGVMYKRTMSEFGGIMSKTRSNQ